MQVTIAGGGVAGTVCAIALRRIGADVTVYETYPDPAGKIGSFLSLAGNGLRALDAIGCLEAVQAVGHEVPTQRMWAGSGRLLGEVPRGRRSDDPLHSITLHRADLVTTLRDTASNVGAHVITGEQVVGIDHTGETGERVHVRLASGNTVDSDLLIGADGIWSTVRTLLDPHAPHPAYAGIYTASGAAKADIEPGVLNMTFARGGAFIHGAGLDTTDGTVWWAAQVADPGTPDLDTVDLALLREVYRHEPHVLDILAGATELNRPTLDHVLAPVPTWHTGRTVLVGDAAHPVGAGQGASMAIEDAVVLTQRLAAAPVPAALAAYEQTRRPRITKVLKTGQVSRDRKTRGPVRTRFTDTMMSFGIKHFYGKATNWLYTYDVGALPVSA